MSKYLIVLIPIAGLFVFILTWLATNKLMMPLQLDDEFRLYLSGTLSLIVAYISCAISMNESL